jgi:hypothetical protein
MGLVREENKSSTMNSLAKHRRVKIQKAIRDRAGNRAE